MKILRDFGQQEGLQRFLASFVEDEKMRRQVHGVSLGYDEYWLTAASEIMHSRWWPEIRHYPPVRFARLFRMNEPEFQDFFRELLEHYRPPGWAEHARRKGYSESKSPIVIKVLVRSRDVARNPNLARSFEGHPVVYQYRADCVAYAATLTSGDSVGPVAKTEGTLGGFLENSNTGDSFLTTCGHVVDSQSSDVYSPSTPSGGKMAVGQVDWKILPPQKTVGGVCNNRGNANAIRVDLALVKLDPNAAVPAPSVGLHLTPISAMTTGDPIVFDGFKSKRVQAEIKDLNLWREVKIAGKEHCFGDLFTITPRHRVYINTALAKDGDSGSWIMYDGPHSVMRSWEGMLVAGDGAEVYCCFAENILDECDKQYGVGNVILP